MADHKPERQREPVPASVARDAAREAHRQTVVRELLYAAILSRLWPSFKAELKRQDPKFPCVLCIDTPAGRIAYKLSVEDMEGFEHVTDWREDDAPCSATDKLARLLDLGVNWADLVK